MEIACLYVVGRKRRILVKNRGKCQNPGILIKSEITARKKGHIKKECFKLQNRENKFGNNQ